MPRGDMFKAGIIEGHQRNLMVLAACIDVWPNIPSDISMELLTRGELDYTAIRRELERFTRRLDELPRRQRKATDGVQISEESEATQ